MQEDPILRWWTANDEFVGALVLIAFMGIVLLITALLNSAWAAAAIVLLMLVSAIIAARRLFRPRGGSS